MLAGLAVLLSATGCWWMLIDVDVTVVETESAYALRGETQIAGHMGVQIVNQSPFLVNWPLQLRIVEDVNASGEIEGSDPILGETTLEPGLESGGTQTVRVPLYPALRFTGGPVLVEAYVRVRGGWRQFPTDEPLDHRRIVLVEAAVPIGIAPEELPAEAPIVLASTSSAETPPTGPVVLVQTGDPAYYNDAIGARLNGTSEVAGKPHFPVFGDPFLNFGPGEAPDLSAASDILGGWLDQPLPDLSAPGWSTDRVSVPSNWPVNSEAAIVYVFDSVAIEGLKASVGVDNGVYVWLDGEFKGGALRPGGVALGEHVFELGDIEYGTHYLQILLEDHGTTNGFQILIEADAVDETPPPLPDLRVASLGRDATLFDTQTLALSGRLDVDLENRGEGEAGAFDVRVFEDQDLDGVFDPTVDEELGSTRVGAPVGPGETVSLSIPVEGELKFRDALIYVMLDAASEVEESDEENNQEDTGSLSRFLPIPGAFDAALEWEWSGSPTAPAWNQVMMTPMVADLDLDGVPEIVFNTFRGGAYQVDGRLRAIRGDGSGEVFTVTSHPTHPGSTFALGNIDDDPMLEIVAIDSAATRMLAFEHDGEHKWTSPPLDDMAYGAASLADLDGDGVPEVISGRSVLNADGTIRWRGAGSDGARARSIVADIDLDGVPEIIGGNTVYRADGSIAWTNGSVVDGWTAVADFDADPFAEIVVVGTGRIWLLEHDGSVAWGPVTLPGGGAGGPPTIGDVDGDGEPEIGVAGNSRYVVFETDGSIRWSTVTRDGSSQQTGSTVFDLDGDGSVEVVYGDELMLRVYRGTDGTVLWSVPSPSGTLFEYPLAVDVDGDGNAEIVKASNNYAFRGTTGIQVFGDASDGWVSTRTIWNQHSYHVTNVEVDGSIPAQETNNWQVPGLNHYRLNAFAPDEGRAADAPDLTASYIRLDQTYCEDRVDVYARIGNGGSARVGPGVVVRLFDGDPRAGGVLIGEATTYEGLLPDEFIDLVMPWERPPRGLRAIFVEIDTAGVINEGFFDNNEAFADLEVAASRPVGALTSGDGPVVPPGHRIIRLATDLADVNDIHRDPFGRLLVTESGAEGFGSDAPADGTVRQLLPDGESVVISSGYFNPTALLVDGDGTLYVADSGPEIFTGDLDGSLSRDPGTGPLPLSTGYTTPLDLIFDPASSQILLAELSGQPPLVLSDAGIYAVDPVTGAATIYFDDLAGPPATNLTNITALAVDPLGNVVALDNGTANLHRITSASTQIPLLAASPFVNPRRVEFDGLGNAWVADPDTDAIYRIAAGAGAAQPFVTGPPGGFIGLLVEDSTLRDPAEPDQTLYFTESGSTVWKLCRGDGPEANDLALTTPAMTPIFANLTGSDPDGEALTFEVLSGPENGELIGAPPTLTYVPDFDFEGTDVFEFFVSNGAQASSPARVTIQVGPGAQPTRTTGIICRAKRGKVDVVWDAIDGAASYRVFRSQQGQGLTELGQTQGTVFADFRATEGVTFTYTVMVVNELGQHSQGSDLCQVTPLARADIPDGSPPMITSDPVATGLEGETYVYDVMASDADQDTLRYSLPLAPLSMAIDPDTGVVTWTPTNDDVGPETITVRVDDGTGLFDTQTYSLRILDLNAVPRIVSEPPLTATENAPYGYDVEAEDPDPGDVLAYALELAPEGMSIDGASGVISWIPGDEQFGPQAVQVRVQDSRGAFDLQSFAIEVANVNDGPLVDAGPDKTVTEGDTVSLAPASFTDPDPDDTHVADVDWADGSPGETAQVVAIAGGGLVDAEHVYPQNDAFDAQVCVSDAAGARDCGAQRIVVENAAPAGCLVGDISSAFTPIELRPSDVGSASGSVFGTLPTDDPALFGLVGDDVRRVDFDVAPDGTALASGTALWDQYAELGVTMNGIVLRSSVYGGPASPPNATFEGSTVRQVFRFAVPVAAVGVINTSPDQDLVQFYAPGVDPDAPDAEPLYVFRDQEGEPKNFNVDRFVGGRAIGGGLIGSLVLTNNSGDIELDELIFEVASERACDGPLEPQEQIAAEGSEISLALTFRDPGIFDTHTATIDWGDGLVDAADIVENAGIGTASGTHVFGASGFYEAEVCVTDDEGATGCERIPLRIVNAPIELEAGDDAGVSLGEDFVLGATFTDPGFLDVHQATIDWGDGSVDDGVVIEADGRGTVEGAHRYAEAGRYSVRVCVDDGEEQTCDSLTVNVQGAPVILSIPITGATQDRRYEYRVVAIDPNDDALTISLDEFPAGLADEGEGTLVWTPSNAQVGTNPVAVRVTDTTGLSTTQAFEIQVVDINDPPSIVSSPGLAANEGETYSYAIQATDPDGDASGLTFQLGLGVSNMAIDASTGLLEWTPFENQLGAFDVLVRVYDAGGLFDEQAFTIEVSNVPDAPIIVSLPPTAVLQEGDYRYPVIVQDPDVDEQFGFSLDSRPDGMTIDPRTGVVTWTPGPEQVGTATVGVRVEDRDGLSASQDFELVVVDSSDPPRIVSTPITSATQGSGYTYDVESEDPDPGDVGRFSLDRAPAEMVIDESSGVITWTPTADQVAPQTVTVRVTDVGDLFDTQTFEIQVADVNDAPVIVSEARTTAAALFPYAYPVIVQDPDVGDTLTYGLDEAPGGMEIGPDGVIRWTPGVDVAEPQTVAVRVTDSAGESDVQRFDVGVVPDQEAPIVSVQVTPGIVDVDEPATIRVIASDDTEIDTLVLTVSGEPLALDPQGVATFVPSAPGRFDIAAVATDVAGNSRDAATLLRVLDPNDQSPPVIALTSPAEDSEIVFLEDVVGTASDENLAFYEVSVRRRRGGPAISLFRGTRSVVDDVLGTLDATTLENGLYDLLLVAEDVNGYRTGPVSTPIQIEGRAKVGLFTIGFTDLRIDLSGIPIAVHRRYSSQLRAPADFGVNWELGIARGSYENNRLPGESWQILSGGGFFNFPCQQVVELAPHRTRVEISDVEQYLFGMTLTNVVPSFGGCFAQVGFELIDGTYPGARLEVLGDPNVLYQNGFAQLLDTTGALFRPEGVRLTTLDGRVVDLDRTKGITRIQDPNGNSLFVSDSGLSHSSGRSVQFDRDGSGRIERIVDPMGEAIQYHYDAAGDLVEVIDREGGRLLFVYEDHLLIRIEDGDGRALLLNEFDDAGRLVASVDGNGFRTSYEHRLDELVELVFDDEGNVTRLEYDELGNVLLEVDPTGVSVRRTYQGDRVKTRNENGVLRSYDYEDGLLVAERLPLGQVVTYTRNAQGRIESKENALGEETRYEYDSRGNVEVVSHPNGTTRRFTYDERGNIETLENEAGEVTAFDYDGFGNIVKITDGEENDFEFTYDALGQVKTFKTTVTTPEGPRDLVYENTYDANGNLVATRDADGHSAAFAYNDLGKLSKLKDPRGNELEMEYDPAGHRSLIRYGDGMTSRFKYGQGAQLLETERRDGLVDRLRYDAAGRGESVIFADDTPDDDTDNVRVGAAYASSGRVESINQPGFPTKRYRFDEAGRVTAVVSDVDGEPDRELSYEYDVAGRMRVLRDPLGNETEMDYDERGWLEKVTYSDDTFVEWTRDGMGRPTSYRDQNGNTTRFEYDGVGRLVKVTDPDLNETEYTYDEAGRLVEVRDAKGAKTRYEYDGRGHRTAAIKPLGQRAEWRYDSAGNMVEHRDFGGVVTQFEYDELNRMTKKRFEDDSTVEVERTASGRPESITDARGMTRYEYDSNNRLTKRIEPDGRTIEYTYRSDDRVASITTPAGTIGYEYDAFGQLERVTEPGGLFSVFRYDPRGLLVRSELANGVVETRDYDDLGLLEGLRHEAPDGSLIASYDYARDDAGNIRFVNESSGRSVEFAYDALQRLEREVISESGVVVRTTRYTYDEGSYRKTRNDSVDGLTSYDYDANGRLRTVTAPSGTTRFDYDANGRLETRTSPDETISYRWNDEHRLVGVTLNDAEGELVIGYQYDQQGNRVTEIVDGEEQRFLVDAQRPLSQVLEEYAPDGSVLTHYVHGSGLLAQDQLSGRSQYLHDGHSGVRQLTDGSGSVTDAYSYDAFGQLAGISGDTPNRHLYRAEALDPELGTYYLRQRYMDPGTGTFLSVDPVEGVLEMPQSLNPYLYAFGNPVTLTDPSGLFPSSLEQMQVLATRVALASLAVVTLQQVTTNVYDRLTGARGTQWKGQMAYATKSGKHARALTFGTNFNFLTYGVENGAAINRLDSQCIWYDESFGHARREDVPVVFLFRGVAAGLAFSVGGAGVEYRTPAFTGINEVGFFPAMAMAAIGVHAPWPRESVIGNTWDWSKLVGGDFLSFIAAGFSTGFTTTTVALDANAEFVAGLSIPIPSGSYDFGCDPAKPF